MNLSEKSSKNMGGVKNYICLSVTMVTLSTIKIPLSDLSFLSFLSSQGGCFAVVADLCGYFAEVKEVPA